MLEETQNQVAQLEKDLSNARIKMIVIKSIISEYQSLLEIIGANTESAQQEPPLES